MIRLNDRESSPSIIDIAEIYRSVVEHVTRDINGRLQSKEQHLFCQVIICGHCPAADRLKLCTLSPIITEVNFSVDLNSVDIPDGTVAAFGSGAQSFSCALDHHKGDGTPLHMIVERFLEEGAVTSVGGTVQFARAWQDGVEVLPTLVQDPEIPDRAKLVIGGFDVDQLGRSMQIDFGTKAYGAGIHHIQGRRALRDKGIDPDRSQVSQAVQNTASLELALRDSKRSKAPVSITGSFTLEAPDPGVGRWYCGARCHCGQLAPICEAPPPPVSSPAVIGRGTLNFECRRCGERLTISPDKITLFRWGRKRERRRSTMRRQKV